MRLRALAVAAASLAILSGCGAGQQPQAVTHVALVAQAAAAGEPVSGMSEVVIDGPPQTWDKIQALAAGVQAANPGVTSVKIVDYNLMRIESTSWHYFVSWTGVSAA